MKESFRLKVVLEKKISKEDVVSKDLRREENLKKIKEAICSGSSVADVSSLAEETKGGYNPVLDGLNERAKKGEDVSLQIFEAVNNMVEKGSF